MVEYYPLHTKTLIQNNINFICIYGNPENGNGNTFSSLIISLKCVIHLQLSFNNGFAIVSVSYVYILNRLILMVADFLKHIPHR